MQFPRLVIPLSVVLTRRCSSALNLVVVFVFILSTAWSRCGPGSCCRC